ncbi:hypothetical protein DFQ27_000469 [Actinomortierella ambigua]|uniref:BRISC and BRCA1-A complex member 2 n=1 Tax=Actinomortierella ambigua TaxID=1343610 RepID=A0A9P6UA20_9FUNG|nr:hypothetical protein DFQ27_000469 [Actinomortierella ambigua]
MPTAPKGNNSKGLPKPGYVFLDKMNYWVPITLHHAIQCLSKRTGQTLFAVKNVSLHSTRTYHNSAGDRVADILRMAIRTSTISLHTFDLEFHFDSYDWTFPPDLILVGSPLRPSLRDIGLDDSWDAGDRTCLSKHEERLKVASLQNERIQFEYSTLHEREEMDCGVVVSDGPTKVLFAVPFEISYRCNGRDEQKKAVVKVQYTISALVENNVTSVQSNIEFLSDFKHPEITSKLNPIGFDESIHDYIEEVQRTISHEFDRKERGQRLRKSLLDELAATFRKHLLECDTKRHTYISILFNAARDSPRQETYYTAIITIVLTEKFPEEYPKIVFSSPGFPVRVQNSLQNSLDTSLSGGVGSLTSGGAAGGQGGSIDLLSETIIMPRYSPRWDAKRMVEAIWEYLWEEIPRFHERVLAHPVNSLSASGTGSGLLNTSSGSLPQSRS